MDRIPDCGRERSVIRGVCGHRNLLSAVTHVSTQSATNSRCARVCGASGSRSKSEQIEAVSIPQGNGSEPHDRPVPCSARVCWSAPGVTGLLERRERGSNRDPDVEAPARRAEMAVPPPAHVALELVDRIPTRLDDTLREAERHRGVVRPLTGLQPERAATDHLGDGSERPARLEFDRRAQRIAGSETEQRSTEPTPTRDHRPPLSRDVVETTRLGDHRLPPS